MRDGSLVTIDTPCAHSGCTLGGVIRANTPAVWSPRRGPGKFHPACLAALSGETPAPAPIPAPAPVPPPVVPAPAPAATPNPVVSSPAPAGVMDAAAALAAALAAASGNKAVDRDEVAAIVAAELERVRDSFGIRRYEVIAPDRPEVDCGVQHKYFPRALDLLTRQRDSYIWGPPGTGKTQAFINAAEALGLDCAVLSLSPQTPASKLEGFVDAQGRYTQPDFWRVYTQGGVFVCDEMDNAPSALMTTLNPAIANGVASLPCGMVRRHPDFIFIGTGNTNGRGPTQQYPERRKLDSSIVSRVRFLHWPPDEELELSLALAHCGGKDAEARRWVRWVQAMREYTQRPDCGVTGTVYADMRAVIGGAQEIAAPMDWTTARGMADDYVGKGLPADQWDRLLAAVPLPQGVL